MDHKRNRNTYTCGAWFEKMVYFFSPVLIDKLFYLGGGIMCSTTSETWARRPQVLRCWEFRFTFYWHQNEICFHSRFNTDSSRQQHTHKVSINTFVHPSTQHCQRKQAVCSMPEWQRRQNSRWSELSSVWRSCISVQMALMWSDDWRGDQCHLLLQVLRVWWLCRWLLRVWVRESLVNELAGLLLSRFVKPIKSVQNPLNINTALSPG